jgi:subtilisin-like proprotein convertase family protein
MGFLLVAGGTHHGITVQGLGKTVAEQIMYLGLTVYLQSATPSRWTFRQARLAMLDACKQRYPDDAAKLAAVMNAWAAVGVGEPAEPSPLPAETVIRLEAKPGLSIPDATPSGVSSVLTITRSGQIGSLTVAVDIAHSYIGDLQVWLTAPNGTTVLLHRRTGASSRDLVKTYDASTTPELATLLGAPVQGDWRLAVADLARQDVGQLRWWRLEIGLDTAPQVARGEATPALAIPDNNPAGVRSTIAIAPAGLTRALKIVVDITHTYIGDLRLELVAPTGQRVVLHNRTGGAQDNLFMTYDSTTMSVLAGLVGVPSQGEWHLQIADLAGRDVGKLNHWSLDLAL